MHYTVITTSRSGFIGNGLTYESSETLKPGQAVKVPLRGQVLEGVAIDAYQGKEDFDVKGIQESHTRTLLTEAQMKTSEWIASYYRCSLRAALGLWLPGNKWWKLLDDLEPIEKHSFDALALPTLTESQQTAYDSLQNDARPSLLFGVTGSGKTEVYAHLIADTLKKGKQAIVLVPEILLTEHIVERLTKIFGEDCIALWHSRLTPARKRKTWQRIYRGDARLIIGSRSALFTPTRELGLVVIDEEHEWTYKNEQTPRYHARETAEVLCSEMGAKLVLGSATPSLESWTRKEDRYHFAQLKTRYNDAELPTVKIVDLGTVNFGKLYPFSPPLLEALKNRLEKKEQSVLLLNRRGTATSLLCMECRRRVISPESQLPFTVHTELDGRPYLLDHLTGVRADVPERCPGCGSTELRPVGAGTAKVEHILKNVLPEARVLRADRDVLTSPEQMSELLETMKAGEADILLGTESVAKGLDLPNVTLAAVLVADIGMSLPHFRAGERTFQLLTQLTGRSGRAKSGDVIIQAFRPKAPEVLYAANHDTEGFLEYEKGLRSLAKYPPMSTMIRLIVRDDNPEKRAKKLRDALIEKAGEDAAKYITTSATLFGGGREWHVLLRGNNPATLLDGLKLDKVFVDVDPMDCL